MKRAAQTTLDAALAEGEAVATVLRSVREAEWQTVTDCPEWTVRDMAAHLVAQAEGTINPMVAMRRMWAGARRFTGRTGIDAYTAQGIAEHAGEAGPALAEAFALLWPKAVRTMRLAPGIVRAYRTDSGVPGLGKITVAYLFDRILPRDLLMHRIDLSRALGLTLQHRPHEALIVGDVLRDLAKAWRGPAVTLRLSGPAGGQWHLGSGTAVACVEADTIDYLRALAGRNDRPELTVVDGDESLLSTVAGARVVF